MIHQERNNSGIDRARTRTHHQAIKWGKAHGGVDWSAMVYRRNRTAVAQMAGNKTDFVKVFA